MICLSKSRRQPFVGQINNTLAMARHGKGKSLDSKRIKRNLVNLTIVIPSHPKPLLDTAYVYQNASENMHVW